MDKQHGCNQADKTREYNVVTERLTLLSMLYRGADMSLARPGRKQATAIEDSDFHISYL
jgi:hypothetical protein